MTRQEKYPETSTFHFHNANPKNRLTGDCVARAICTAAELNYSTVVKALATIQCDTGFDGCCPEGYGKLLSRLGWTKHKQPRKPDGSKYTGKEFCRELMAYDSMLNEDFNIRRVIANIGGGHVAAIIEGRVYDTWDCTDGCIGNFWTKEDQ